MLHGYLYAENSTFRFRWEEEDPGNDVGITGEYNHFEFIDCNITGGIHGRFGTCSIENCVIRAVGNHWNTSTYVSGPECRLIGSRIDGHVGVGTLEEDEGEIIIEDNIITRSLAIGVTNGTIRNNNIGGMLRIHYAGRLNFYHCILPSAIEVIRVDEINIDSCMIVNEENHPNFFHIRSGPFNVTRSVIISDGMDFDPEVTGRLDHNTIVFRESDWDCRISRVSSEVVFTNNIFYTETETDVLFYSDSTLMFEYNCMHGFENFRKSVYEYFDASETNITADPQLEWYGTSPLLTANSPCIDAGDPDAPLDRDGTRSDLGAWAYDQPGFVRPRSGYSGPNSPILIEAYPNPFNNNLKISYKSSVRAPLRVSLLDVTGREVLDKSRLPASRGNGFLTLDTSSLPTGRYHIQIVSDNYRTIVPVNRVK